MSADTACRAVAEQAATLQVCFRAALAGTRIQAWAAP